MRIYFLLAAALVALLLILPRMGQDREPLVIDEPDAKPATWPRNAALEKREKVEPVPYMTCVPVFRPLAPDDPTPIMEVRA
jgi:hypothetical protein